jgi:hypothetical protein
MAFVLLGRRSRWVLVLFCRRALRRRRRLRSGRECVQSGDQDERKRDNKAWEYEMTVHGPLLSTDNESLEERSV